MRPGGNVIEDLLRELRTDGATAGCGGGIALEAAVIELCVEILADDNFAHFGACATGGACGSEMPRLGGSFLLPITIHKNRALKHVETVHRGLPS